MSETNRQEQKRVSHVPSKAWLVMLILFGVIAFATQGLGLHSLVGFTALKREWEATQEQQASLRMEWEQLAEDQKNKAAEAKKEAGEALAAQDMAHKSRDLATAELAGLNEQLKLARQAHQQVLEEQRTATADMKQAISVRGAVLKDVGDLKTERFQLTSEITRLTSDRDRLQQSISQAQTSLETVLNQVKAAKADTAAAQKQESDVLGKLRSAQQEWMKALADVEKTTSAAGEAIKKRQAEETKLAALQVKAKALEQAETDRRDLGEKVALLNTDIKRLKLLKSQLSLETTNATEKLGEASTQLAKVVGQTAAQREQAKQAKDEIDTLTGRRTKIGAEVKVLETERQRLQAAVAEKAAELKILRERIKESRSETPKPNPKDDGTDSAKSKPATAGD